MHRVKVTIAVKAWLSMKGYTALGQGTVSYQCRHSNTWLGTMPWVRIRVVEELRLAGMVEIPTCSAVIWVTRMRMKLSRQVSLAAVPATLGLSTSNYG